MTTPTKKREELLKALSDAKKTLKTVILQILFFLYFNSEEKDKKKYK